MRAAARRLIEQFEVEPEKVNALERPYFDQRADTIPLVWTTGHCGRRIVEAFETLDRLPAVRGPKEPGTAWPPYEYDAADRNSQVIGADASDVKKTAFARNRTIVRATGVDIKRMDAVFDWLHDLRRTDDRLARIVQNWGTLRSRGISIKEACRDAGTSFQSYYRARDKGVGLIVTALNAKPVPVF